MKPHIKTFLLSLVLITLAAILSRLVEVELNTALIEQAKAISYMVTMAGIVIIFGWYKRHADELSSSMEETPNNLKLQSKALNVLAGINLVNAGVLFLTSEQSVHFMIGISLLVVIIAPIIFRTIKEAIPTNAQKDIGE